MTPYYEQDGITIYHGDCRDVLGSDAAMRTGRGTYDLLLTDPPYGLGLAANPVRQSYERQDWDNCTSDEALAVVRSLSRWQIIWGGNFYDLPAAQCFLVWDKGQPEDFSLAMCEQAWTNLKKPAKLYRKWALSYTRQHPTQKPEDLMAWCIRQATEATGVILDPFMGSGTTLVAAKRLGRQAIGIEREERYCEVAVKRLAQGALDLFGEATA